jgi:hypothetical protein
MDLATSVVLLGVAAAPLALLGGWLASRDRAVSTPLGTTADGWWRQTLPWPHGVQEDDDVQWHFADETTPSLSADDAGDPVTTVRLRPTVRRSLARGR